MEDPPKKLDGESFTENIPSKWMITRGSSMGGQEPVLSSPGFGHVRGGAGRVESRRPGDPQTLQDIAICRIYGNVFSTCKANKLQQITRFSRNGGYKPRKFGLDSS